MSEVKNYRKKPVVIQALEYTGDLKSAKKFLGIKDASYDNDSRELVIPTLEDGSTNQAKHVASIGDYIIKGIQGEFYPCKPDIFVATYEEVSE